MPENNLSLVLTLLADFSNREESKYFGSVVSLMIGTRAFPFKLHFFQKKKKDNENIIKEVSFLALSLQKKKLGVTKESVKFPTFFFIIDRASEMQPNSFQRDNNKQQLVQFKIFNEA